jgi:hypothetical protein
MIDIPQNLVPPQPPTATFKTSFSASRQKLSVVRRTAYGPLQV